MPQSLVFPAATAAGLPIHVIALLRTTAYLWGLCGNKAQVPRQA